MQWYDEIKDHDFSRDFQPGTGMLFLFIRVHLILCNLFKFRTFYASCMENY
jgi:hypothetical protein